MKCLECKKEFEVGDWTCRDGVTNHIVAEKTYRVCDAPAEPGEIPKGQQGPVVRGRTMVCNIPPPKKVMRGDEVVWVGEGSVEFINGRFATSDPEKQHWLDKKPGYNATEDQWKANWWTKEELLADQAIELHASKARLENERNELLAQVKRQKTA